MRERGSLPGGLLGWGWTMLMVIVSWVIFRSTGVIQAAAMLKHMIFLTPAGVNAVPAISFLAWDRLFYLILGIALALLPLERLRRMADATPGLFAVERFGTFVLFLFTVISMSVSTFNPFIYFRF